MSAQTVLMDFVLQDSIDTCEQIVKEMLESQLAGEKDVNILKLEMRHSGQQVDTVMYSSQGDLMIMIRIDKREKLLTINMDGPHLAPTGSQFKDNNLKNKAQQSQEQSSTISTSE